MATGTQNRQGGYQGNGTRGGGNQGNQGQRGGYQRPAQNNQQAPDNTGLLQTELANAKHKLVKAWDETGAETVINWVLRAYRLGDDRLRRSTIRSIVDSAVQIAVWQMDPNPILGLIYLEPRWLKEVEETQCAAKLTYRGLLELLRRSGEVTQFYAEVVYANDEFRPMLGTDMKILHVPAIGRDRGEFWCAYSVAWLKGAPVPSVQIMEDEEIQKCKAMSKVQGVWKDWFGEKAKISVAKRHTKWLALSATVKRAIMVDEQPDFAAERNPIDPPAGDYPDEEPQDQYPQDDPGPDDNSGDSINQDGQQDGDPFEDTPAPPTQNRQPSRQAPPPDPKVLRERARVLIPQVRKTGPDVIDTILQQVGIAALKDLGTADAAVLQQFNQACERVLRV